MNINFKEILRKVTWRLLGCRSWGNWEVTASGYRDDKKIQKLVVVMTAKVYEYTKTRLTVHFRRLDCMVCEFISIKPL